MATIILIDVVIVMTFIIAIFIFSINSKIEKITKSLKLVIKASKKASYIIEDDFADLSEKVRDNWRHLLEIKRIVSSTNSFNKPKVFLKGESMDGKHLIVTVARPKLTAGDICKVLYNVYFNNELKHSTEKIPEIEAVDFKILKGKENIKIGVVFVDTSGNASEETFSEFFNTFDTIPPGAPGAITISLREEYGEDENDDYCKDQDLQPIE